MIDIKYIESRVTIEDECWIWNGSRDKDGYGLVKIRVGKKKRTRRVHRIMYKLYYNCRLTKHDHIMHICDNPSCCNPLHLRKGNRVLNMRDMVLKGRHFKQRCIDKVDGNLLNANE